MSEEVDSIMESVSSSPSTLMENIKSFTAGGFGGVCAVLTGHPFDLMKVRLQTNQSKTTIAAATSIIKYDGLLGFYRGVIPPLAGVTPMFAVSFWGYDLGRQLVEKYSKIDPIQGMSIAQVSAAGFFSAIPTTAIAAPFERVKVVMQIQNKTNQTTTMQAVKQILATGGLRSLFKGSLATVARDGPGSALYFATYEYLKKELTQKDEDLSLLAVSIAGGFAGVAMWLGVFPIDTIKSVQQSQEKSISMAAVTKQIYSKGGVKAFFPGIGPALLRSFPANAATFVGVEVAKKFLNEVI